MGHSDDCRVSGSSTAAAHLLLFVQLVSQHALHCTDYIAVMCCFAIPLLMYSYASKRTLPILFSTFVIPILFVTSIIATRVMCEALLSILLVPTLLSSNYSRYRETNTASTTMALPINGVIPRPTAAPAAHQQHQQHHAVLHHPPVSRAPLPPNSHIHASHGSSSSNLMGSYEIDSALDNSSAASSPYITGDSRIEIQPATSVQRAVS
jgi:hypothetical protein